MCVSCLANSSHVSIGTNKIGWRHLVSTLKRRRHLQRVKGGTNHQIYRHSDLIFRFSHSETNAIAVQLREAELLESLGLPLTPTPVWYGMVGHGRNHYAVSIYPQIPGNPLGATWPSLRPRVQRGILTQLCEFLRSLHGVVQNSFWDLLEDRPFRTFGDLLEARVQQYAEMLRMSSHVSRQDYVPLVREVTKHSAVFRNETPVIVHNDLSAFNILVNANRVSGVLDFERSLSGPQQWEVFRLLYFQACALIDDQENREELAFTSDFLQAVRESYASIFNSKYFDVQYRLALIVFCLQVLCWAASHATNKERSLVDARRFVSKLLARQ